jgi:hypothetical protein
MSLIIPANTLASGGFSVANSCRFNPGSSDALTKTLGSGGNRKTFTISLWTKASSFSEQQMVLSADDNQFGFTNEPVIFFYENNGGTEKPYIKWKPFYRDTSAWYHICLAVDTTQGTNTNRMKLYVNGSQVTEYFSTPTHPDENQDLTWNTNVAHAIGRYSSSGGHYNGYMAEYVLIDGSALAPTSFGEFDEDSGIWKPIDVSGLTFGTNGFYLDFEDSSALGNDAANSNDWTVSNLTAIDQSTDTCTNNFATMNPLDKIPIGSAITYSDGNLTTTASAGSDWTTRYSFSTIAVSQGKWYVECKVGNVGAANQFYVGVIKNRQTTTFNTSLGYISNNGYGYYAASGNIVNNGSDLSTSGASYTTGDIIGIALDLDSGTLDFYKNGSAQGSQVTSLDTTADWQFTNDALQNAIWNWNFGSPPFAISSGNTDGDGYGNFEYAVPSGYYALNTKNLAEYG